jgi:hypothetical protein
LIGRYGETEKTLRNSDEEIDTKNAIRDIQKILETIIVNRTRNTKKPNKKIQNRNRKIKKGPKENR